MNSTKALKNVKKITHELAQNAHPPKEDERDPPFHHEPRDKYEIRDKVSAVVLKSKTKKKMTALWSDACECINEQKWPEFIDMIKKRPQLLSVRCLERENKTILHTLASSKREIPHEVTMEVIKLGPEALSLVDENGRLPLHCAVQNVACVCTIRLMIECFHAGTGTKDTDGNLPLHIASSIGGAAMDDAVKVLLDAHPEGLAVANGAGQLPLHIACSNPSTSVKSVAAILDAHSSRKQRLSKRDNNGNSPLHAAIKLKAPHEIINLFARDAHSFDIERIFLQKDSEDKTPLHIALNLPNVCPKVVTVIIKAAPVAGAIAFGDGKTMPVQLATKLNMPSSVIFALLVTDMPVNLCPTKVSRDIAIVHEKKHGYSWWHVAVDCKDKYVDDIKDYLSAHATQPQVIALVRSFGPDGVTRIIEAVSVKSVEMLANLLCFYDRYDLLSTEPHASNDDIHVFHALDHGGPSEYSHLTRSGIFNDSDSDPESMLEPVKLKTQVRDDLDCAGVEVSLFDSNERDEVILRCYRYEEAYRAEINVRGLYTFLPHYVEKMNNFHCDNSYKNTTFGSNSTQFISFQRPDHSLALVFVKTSQGSRSPKWISKCNIVLRQIGNAIKHLHEQGLVHGHLDPHNIAKYGITWKLTSIGTVTPIGAVMRGPLRHCSPPESVSKTPVNETFLAKPSVRRNISCSFASDSLSRVTFAEMENISTRTVESYQRRKQTGIIYSCHENPAGTSDDEKSSDSDTSQLERVRTAKRSCDADDVKENLMIFAPDRGYDTDAVSYLPPEKMRSEKQYLLKFSPEQCVASPTWDIWSFGLIMVQLLIGRSVHLPSFEKAEDALIYNLQMYDKSTMKKIREQVRTIAGDDAADLLAKLLHPDPKRRISSMGRVVRHAYFQRPLMTKE